MPSYPELGRHTPPPPPYSLEQRNCSNTIATFEALRSSDPPPPPPPLLNSTQGKEFRMPSPSELEQEVPSSDPYLRHNRLSTPAPPVHSQVSAAQRPNPGQPVEYHARNQYCEFIRFGIPVEPKLVPGSRGHPMRPFDGLSLERSSEPVPHQRLPGCYASPIQSVSTSSLGKNLTSDATQTPFYGPAVDDDQLLPSYSRHSSINTPSIANPNGLDALALVSQSETIHRSSSLPSQKTPGRRPTLTTASTTTSTPKGRHQASPARPTGLSNDHPPQGSEKWRRVSQSSHRKASVSVRFDPYKRRQSSVASEKTEKLGRGSQNGKEAAKETRPDGDVEMEERRGEGERKHKH